ncbi:PTS sugar transporter subunit IIB [Lysinibacillus sp. NPDC097287]|uniref:PTS sugar transporter subunit IIB n=1 Tax=Lysinibacillus sp. NPDC097287 TaxID=3364144 RepID=UPI00380383C3
MKILVVCGNGLGSSFIMQLNVEKALTELGKTAMVTHTDLTSAITEKADIFIGAGDIVERLDESKGKIVSIINMMNVSEIKLKLEPFL